MIFLHASRCVCLVLVSFVLFQGLAFGGYSNIIHRAVSRWDVNVVRALIQSNPGLMEQTDNYGNTPLHNAARNGDVRTARVLLNAGADVNAVSHENYSPLHRALHGGHADMVALLLEYGATLEVEYPLEPFLAIAQRERLEDIERVLRSESARRAEYGVFMDPLRPRAWEYESGAMQQLFVCVGFRNIEGLTRCLRDLSMHARDVRGAHGETLLHAAAYHATHHDRLDMLRHLIDAGMDVNGVDNNGWTPLLIAAERGYLDAVKLLIERGARVDAGDDLYFGGALHRAAYGGPMFLGRVPDHIDVLGLLLDRYPNLIDAQDRLGNTPLHYAARYGRLAAVELLLARGADALIVNDDGETPMAYVQDNPVLDVPVQAIIDRLWPIEERFLNEQAGFLVEAIQAGNIERMRALIDGDAVVDWTDELGFIALHYAAAEGQDAAAELLLEESPDSIDYRNDDGCTPLHLAAMRGHASMVRLLLNRRARTDLVNDNGFTALQLAEDAGRLEIVRMLREEPADDDAMEEAVMLDAFGGPAGTRNETGVHRLTETPSVGLCFVMKSGK